MIQTSRKTAMPTRLASVVTIRTIAPACSNNAKQKAAIPTRPALFMATQLTKKLNASWNILNARSKLVPRP